VQRLARDVTEVADLREEVTRAWVAAIMAEARTAWVGKMAQERAVLLATARGKADVAARRSSILEGKLMAVRRARDAAEEKLTSLAAKVATTNR
jgi:hypothetical protein